MKDALLTIFHPAVVVAKLLGPGGVRAVAAENLLLKHQLIVLRRPRQRAPNLTVIDPFPIRLRIAVPEPWTHS